MKIILTEEVQGVGYEGDIAEVKDGYARNFLLPQGLAVLANKENLAEWEANQEEIQAKRKDAEAKATELKELIEKTVLVITTKAGEEGKIFGSVTSQDIADAFKEKTGEEIEKKKIALQENIKSIGEHNVTVKVFPEITAELVVKVQNQDGQTEVEEENVEAAVEEVSAEEVKEEENTEEVEG